MRVTDAESGASCVAIVVLDITIERGLRVKCCYWSGSSDYWVGVVNEYDRVVRQTEAVLNLNEKSEARTVSRVVASGGR